MKNFLKIFQVSHVDHLTPVKKKKKKYVENVFSEICSKVSNFNINSKGQ